MRLSADTLHAKGLEWPQTEWQMNYFVMNSADNYFNTKGALIHIVEHSPVCITDKIDFYRRYKRAKLPLCWSWF